MAFLPSRLVLLLLLPTLLLCSSCRSQRPLLVDSLSQVSSRVQQRTELEASLLRSLSSFLSVDVIDSLFLLASPVQPASGVLLQIALLPLLLPVCFLRQSVTIIVRQMKATIKPEAMVALRKSFVAGGFMGHTDNSLQEWDYETDETQPLETIRKHKDGKWYGYGGSRFTIEAQPREFHDYNF